MKTTVISFDVGQQSIRQAIKELKAYKQHIADNTEIYRRRLADLIKDEAQRIFSVSGYDSRVDISVRASNVLVRTREGRLHTTVVFTEGDRAVWIEFGAGVYYNGSAGTSPHPKGAKFGFTIGSYGLGKGRRKAWGYYDEKHQLVITHGTLATMPMYNAAKSIMEKADTIAKEVWQ